jgi:phosphinothricin acetyltransferase
MHPDDWPDVRETYREGIVTGDATFETDLPDWEKWNSSHRKDCRLVAREGVPEESLSTIADCRVLGWAALSPVSPRHVYSGVAEVSVYVASAARGSGVGKALLQAVSPGI